MPLASLVSEAIYERCCGDISACSASGVLGVSVFVRFVGDTSACSASGVLGVCSCINELLY